MMWTRGRGQHGPNTSPVNGQTHRAVCPRIGAAGLPLAIFCPGSHDGADSTVFFAGPNLARLAVPGLLVATLDMNQTGSQGTFGNATALARIGDLRTFLTGSDTRIPASTGPMHLLGGSGGACAALNYARAHPDHVASVTGIVPLTDLRDLYDHRTDGSITQAEIRAAHGNAVPNYGTVSPIENGTPEALAAAEIPVRLYYSENDPYIPVATVEAFQAAVLAESGDCHATSMGAVGHSDTGLDYRQIARWLAKVTAG